MKRFPIQREDDLSDAAKTGNRMAFFPRGSVPWSVAEKAYAAYSAKYGTSQSLKRLGERGGFGHWEMDYLHGPGWRKHFVPDEKQYRTYYLIDMATLPEDFTLVKEYCP